MLARFKLSKGYQDIMRDIGIKYCDIPDYLYNGEFYRSLSEDDPQGIIRIPADCFQFDGETEEVAHFKQILRVMTFWSLDQTPKGIIDFCRRNDIEVWRDAILNLPGGDKPSLALVEGLQSTFSQRELIDFSGALNANNWDIIEYCINCIDPKADRNSVATVQAALYGNLRALKLLHEQGFAWDVTTCDAASCNGHLDCLQYAHENGSPWDVKVYIAAIEHGHLHIIQYAHQQGLEWTADVSACASNYGQLECLQYALEQGCSVDLKSSNAAAVRGDLECLQLLHLHQHQAPWDEDTCTQAAMRADTTCLQYLHEHECPWDDRTPHTAVYYGSIECLRYAMNQNCDFRHDLMITAAQGGDLHCLQYLLEEQGLYMDEDGHVFLAALLKGNLQCLQYLIDQGCPIQTARFSPDDPQMAIFDAIFTKNNPEFVQCLQYAVERGWQIDQNCINYLISRDWDNCKKYLIEEGYVVDTLENYDQTDHSQLFEVVAFAETESSELSRSDRSIPTEDKFYRDEYIDWISVKKRTFNDWKGAPIKGDVKFAKLVCCPLCDMVTLVAATKGHGPCLSSALGLYATHPDACTAAARGGHLDCLTLLYEYHTPNTPWDVSTTNASAEQGHLPTLTYAIDNGCPLDEDNVVALATATGNLPSLRYLIGTKGLYMNEDGSVFGAAFVRADYDCVLYLLDVGCPFADYVFGGIEMWPFYQAYHNTVTNIDARFLSCIELAVQRGWQLGNKPNLDVYINAFKPLFPRCFAHFVTEGLIIIES